MLRFGGPIIEKWNSPKEWIALHIARGYNAAYCPVGVNDSQTLRKEYRQAAHEADIIIAEVGAWSNPLSGDETQRRQAIAHCKAQLALAEEMRVRCCVNITGSRGTQWDGHSPLNLTQETFDMIVATTQDIIDAVNPTHTRYTLECMPWSYPDTPQSYARLLKAIDRPGCGAHLDPVNMVCSPQLYYNNGAMIKECFELLKPWLCSCHGKDIAMSQKMTVHLDEVIAGNGNLDYATLLQELNATPDVPLMLEHLSTEEEYEQAATYVRSVASQLGISMPQPQK